MNERGQALVEATLVLPVCLASALAIVDCGLIVRDRLAVTQAATRAAEARLAGTDVDGAARAALPSAMPGVQVRVDGDRVLVRGSSRTWLTTVARIDVQHRSDVQLDAVEDVR